MEKVPKLSYKCPKLWAEMRGDERVRHCDVCNCNVYNLSCLSGDERLSLYRKAKSERVCGAFYQSIKGSLITAERPSFGRQAGVAAVITLAALSGCQSPQEPTVLEDEDSELIFTMGIICPVEDEKPEERDPQK